jgi:hypothetical protein
MNICVCVGRPRLKYKKRLAFIFFDHPVIEAAPDTIFSTMGGSFVGSAALIEKSVLGKLRVCCNPARALNLSSPCFVYFRLKIIFCVIGIAFSYQTPCRTQRAETGIPLWRPVGFGRIFFRIFQQSLLGIFQSLSICGSVSNPSSGLLSAVSGASSAEDSCGSE